MYIINEQGKWLVDDDSEILIEPSETYLVQRELERLQQEAEESNRPPTEIELLKQQIETSNQAITELSMIIGGVL